MCIKRRKKYELDIATANATLQNILAACEQEPNKIPFDKLVLRQKVDNSIYNRILCILSITIALTLLAPLVVVPVCIFLEQLFL